MIRILKILSMLLFVVLSLTSLASAQEFSLPITVSDGVNEASVITIGVNNNGDNSALVSGLDVTAPPAPPAGAFDARITLGSEDYLTKFLDSTRVNKTVTLNYASATGANPITFTWDASSLPVGWQLKFQDAFGGVILDTDLSTLSGTFTPSSANAAFATSINLVLVPVAAPTVATPTFSPAAGSYTAQVDVSIATTTENATIHYTTDGSTPTTSSATYTTPITITTTSTVKAIAVASGFLNSTVAEAAYTITAAPTLEAVTFSPAAGTYNDSVRVTLANAESSATIYYTTDGSDPTTSSTQYSTPFLLTSTATVKALAVATGFSNSAISEAAYTITSVTASPTFNPAAGSYADQVNVTIASSTPNASIFYTTDGSDPTTSSTAYTSAIQLTSTTTIKAIATSTGRTNSAIAEATYTITETPQAPSDAIFSLPLTVSDGTNSTAITIGLSPNGNNAALVAGLDLSAPPAPPSGSFDARITAGSEAYLIKYLDSTRVSKTVSLGYAAATGTNPITISWNPASLPVGWTLQFQDGFGGAVYTGDLASLNGSFTPSSINAAFSTGINLVLTPAAIPTVETPTFNPVAGSYSDSVDVSISTTTENATIYYTTDGSDPTTSSTQYSSAIRLRATTTLKAIAVATGFNNSAIAEAAYTITETPTLPAVTFSPAAGTYSDSVRVTLANTEASASIYYTTDGSDPTTSSLQYDSPFLITSTATVKAIAVATGFNNSPVAEAAYTITPTAATPTFSPAAGSYSDSVEVSIATTTANAMIYYTTDGSDPSTSSTEFTAPFKLYATATTTVKAIAVATGFNNSAVGEAIYTLNETPTLPAVTFSPAAGNFADSVRVTLANTEASASIYFTTDGSDPTTSSTLYSAPFLLTSDATVKAIATATDFNNSPVAEAAYTITPTAATPTFNPVAGNYTDSVEVSIATTTANATIYYTTDGSDPTTSSTQYTAPFKFYATSTNTVKAIAVATGFNNSAVGEATYTVTVLPPLADVVISPASGSFADSVRVTLTNSEPTATIYYTTDGSIPSTASNVYSGSFLLTSPNETTTTTVRTFATAPNFNNSGVSEASYTITPSVAIPVFSPTTGSYADSVIVSITTATPNATIYYTVDGTQPNENSPVYTAPFKVTQTTIARAFAKANGFSDSPVATAIYNVEITPTAVVPTFNPVAGTYADSVDVSLATTTTGGMIYFTTDGSTPTANSTAYTQPIRIKANTSIKAITVAQGFKNSAVAEATYTITQTPTAAPPAFEPAAGTYADSVDVTLTTTTEGAAIHYTTDGSEPTAQSTVYSAPFRLKATTTVRALAIAEGLNNSSISIAEYIINVTPTALAPSFTPAAGTYADSVDVTLTTTTEGASIRYTLDGSVPTAESTPFTSAIRIRQNTTIKAIAIAEGFKNSPVAEAAYTISDTPTLQAVSFSPSAGSYTDSVRISLANAEASASIFYTTDGSTPSASSMAYSGSFLLTESATVRAIAIADGFNNSPVAEAVYTITATPTASAPVFTPAGGSFVDFVDVVLTTSTNGATIHYTTDGSVPTAQSNTYSEPVRLFASATVRAIAIADGFNNSPVAEAAYTITATPTLAAVTFSPAAGSYTDSVRVSLANTEASASIFYTTDGSTPSASSTAYSGSFLLTETATVRAIAIADGFNNSPVAEAAYTITATPTLAAVSFSPAAGSYADSVRVSLANAEASASIFYTTDGSTPSASSTAYSGSFLLTETATVRAIAIADGFNNSPVAEAAYTITATPTLAAVTFSPAAGSYADSVRVSLSSAEASASIFYTTDGSTPSASSTAYNGSFLLTETATVRAIAIADGFNNSPVAEATYTITATPTLAAVSFSPAAGSYADSVRVSLASAEASASIFYTTDGSTPSASSTAYNGSFLLTETATVRAIAIAEGFNNSAVSEAVYTITVTPTAAVPTFDPAAGTYADSVDIVLASATDGVAIRYTMDGSNPTAESTLYNGPIRIRQNTTVRAIAIAEGFNNSAISEAVYTITVTPTASAPVFEPTEGTYTDSVLVQITSATSEATVFYTTDGSQPNGNSTPYAAAFWVSEDVTVRAIALATGFNSSEVITARYYIESTPAEIVDITEDLDINLDGDGDEVIVLQWPSFADGLDENPLYSFILATDELFNNIVYSSNPSGDTRLRLTKAELATIIQSIQANKPKLLQNEQITLFNKVEAKTEDGELLAETETSKIDATVDSTLTSIERIDEIPTSISLSQNYPNPFNPTTQINYSIMEAGLVTLEIYNLQGQRVATLVDEIQSSGSYAVTFNAMNLPSGVYMYRLNTAGQQLMKKMTLIK